MSKKYTNEKNAQIIISLLKANNINRVVASPGGTNVAFVGSIQTDPFFKVYSSVDERSAAYLACGLAYETGEPVVLSCTGATASRNYLPGLTEAYYRKLPILAITSTQFVGKVKHHVAQVIDRSQMPNDTHRISLDLPIVKDEDDFWECEVKVNQAILELTRHGGGPAHINLPTRYSRSYDVETLPQCRAMKRFTVKDEFPKINGRVAVFIGAHREFTIPETEALDTFCATHNAVVFCDHTSSYHGKYRLLFSLVAGQDFLDLSLDRPDITIHIGEITGDYDSIAMVGSEVWRVSEDGEIRDTFKKLRYIFEMDEQTFFERYIGQPFNSLDSYYRSCACRLEEIRLKIPDLPFSNIWLASQLAHRIPPSSVFHFGILNSLRSWNFFELPDSVRTTSNVGGFGIDGCLSSLIGASLANPNKLYFIVIGDLAFFYDMNALGSRHIGNNVRILLVNNGKGTEFRQYNHLAAHFGEDTDEFVSAAGHFGQQSETLVKNYCTSLGFNYLAAKSKSDFLSISNNFISHSVSARPLLLEVFTDSELESLALELIRNVTTDQTQLIKEEAKKFLRKTPLLRLRNKLRRD